MNKSSNQTVSTMSGKTKVKIVLLGNQSVGKSSIIEKYVKDIFDETSNPTVGIDFLVKNVTYKTKSYRLQLWDTAGQERFRSLIPNYLKDAKCALIIIDVTNRTSLSSVQSWLSLYNDNKTVQGLTLMIGNKIDLEYRQITQQEALKKAGELGIPYFELSAKTGENVESLFLKLIDISQDHSFSAANFQLNQKDDLKQEIKEEAKEEEQAENNKQKIYKNQNNGKEPNKIVLTNQKIPQTNKNNSQSCC